jgi:hypothetical protein
MFEPQVNKLVNKIKSNQLLLQLKAVSYLKRHPVALLLALTVSLTTLQPIFAAVGSTGSGNVAPAALSLEDSAGPIYKPSMVDPTNHLDPNSSWDYALSSTNSGVSKKPMTAKAAANKVKVAAANVVIGKTRIIAQTTGAPVPTGTAPAPNATTLNLNQVVNFLAVEKEIRKVRLLDPNLDINFAQSNSRARN